MTKLRAIWQNLNASYWFFPAVFALVALVLAWITIWLDRAGLAEFLNDVAWIHPSRPDGASNMLTVIAGSMLATASTVFSITIAAVVYASGNYGPRLLTNFMEDRGNQLSLATFIGTFVYAVTVLRTVRSEDEAIPAAIAGEDSLPGFVPQLSLLVAYVLMSLSILVLVYFLNHIPASIRINSVLKGIGTRLLDDIRECYPREAGGDAELARPEGEPVRACGTGYVQMIDFDRLHSLAKSQNGTIRLAVRTGDFVHPEMPIAFWDDFDLVSDLLHDEIRQCFTLGGRRTPNQDLQFLIDELVEITLRALSPAVNDPFTALTAVHWLGAATAELGRRDLRHEATRSDLPDGERLVLLNDNFEHFLGRGFGSLRGSVATNRIAALVTFDTLINASTTLNDASRFRLLRREGDLLMDQAREHLVGPELHAVEARHVSFLQRMERMPGAPRGREQAPRPA